ncbi:cytochrome c biogenesis protein DipZ [Legionella hackeliae]|uniref:Putative Redoxin family protein n=1 Tax=Legionella hackeliae TaxID=449 RepID=A0A0A8UWH7_LEGHA|nr:cytochrome c biogenesis protein DipZ [Legionella hackeliae]KTD15183.1 cytochrome C biogenesis protein [Legionella hackeliae]CEK11452.1 putative Redoxin family protein [Legionella hackeliae]STX48224.1 cytochrome C biogenesis protein [Legionella hackeliae]
MPVNFLDIILAFFEGFALIISPCILPILPIVLAGSLSGSRKRPFGIITGFVISFSLVAFFSRQLVQYSGIDLDLIRHISYGILLLLGIIMMSSFLSEKFTNLLQRMVGVTGLINNNPQGGFVSGIFIGSLIAIIWTPCAGPILAAVIVQTVLQKTTIVSFFILVSFALGAAIPMLIISLYGIKIIETFRFFKTKATFFRKILGLIIIAAVAYMIYQETTQSTSTAQTTIKTATMLQNGLWLPYKAPPIEGIEAWINSPPLKLSDLQGKVVLIDFWTYSCINCIRTIPYLKAWYNKYQNQGLVIIGIHSPEFDFEKNLANVQNAVKRYGIHYPVALDNQFATWRNYNNHYWPAHYLINKNGKVVYQYFGEGDYDVTENNIRYLLNLDSFDMPTLLKEERYVFGQTPETYLGYARADKSLSPDIVRDASNHYHFPQDLLRNAWALDGFWQVTADKITSTQANAALKIHYNARKVFIVMGNATPAPIKVKVFLNNKPIFSQQGKDVTDSTITVTRHSIYEVISLEQFAQGILEIRAETPGLQVYTFTFGS